MLIQTSDTGSIPATSTSFTLRGLGAHRGPECIYCDSSSSSSARMLLAKNSIKGIYEIGEGGGSIIAFDSKRQEIVAVEKFEALRSAILGDVEYSNPSLGE